MTQALCAEDGSLPQGLTVQNTYMELCSGSKNVTVVVRNSMAYPQTLRRKTPVVWAVAVSLVPEPPAQTSLMEALEEAQGWPWSKDEKSCLRSWIWVDWNLGLLSLWTLPGLSWPNTTMSPHWSLVNLAVPIQLNMWLKLLMIPHSKNDLDGFHHH